MTDQPSPRETSVFLTLYQRLLAGVAHAEDAWVVRTGRRLSQGLTQAAAASHLAGFGALVGQWVRGSMLYRWLTAEPDPDVIVIDLRETYTVGPLLAILDWVLGPLPAAWRSASVGAGVRTVQRELRAQPIRVVSIVALAGLVTELALSLVLGGLSQTGLGLRLLVGSLALVGTRVRVSWATCTQSRAYQALVAALAPPEPPEQESEKDRE